MITIKKYNDFLITEKAKHLTDAGIPNSIISTLFDKNYLLNNNVEVEPINKKELKDLLKEKYSFKKFGFVTIIAYLDEDNYVCFSSNYGRNMLIEIKNSQKQYHDVRKTPTSLLKLIPAKYKIFNVLKNITKKSKEEKIKNIYHFTDLHGKFLLEKLKELKSKTIKDVDLDNYRTYNDEYKDERLKLSAISTINGAIDTIINNEKTDFIGTFRDLKVKGATAVFYKLLKHFNDYDKFEYYSGDDIKDYIKELLVKYVAYWNYKDFSRSLTDSKENRTIITRKDMIKIKSNDFNL